jgi:hypothetical protein
MAATIDIAKAQVSLDQDAEAARVFQFIVRQQSAAGWMIVKELGQQPERTEESLAKLRNLGLLEGSGDGLDGFYYATSLGYALHEAL